MERSRRKVPVRQTSLLQDYRHAFFAYARIEDEAVALEYKGESGGAVRESFRTQLGVTEQTFAVFQHAALDVRQAAASAQGRIDAITLSDRGASSGRLTRGPTLQRAIRTLVAELDQQEIVALNSIHRDLDGPTATALDEAVVSFYRKAQANVRDRAGRLFLDPRPAVYVYDPGGTDYCSGLTVDQETQLIDDCMQSGGDFDLSYCSCDSSSGGGGGGPSQPTITNIDPGTIQLGAQNVQLTISGSGFGTAPSVSLPSGVTPTGNQVSSDSSIVMEVNVAYTATVGKNQITVMGPGGASEPANLALDGPFQLVVVSDFTQHCANCSSTVERLVTYQIQNFSTTNAGATQMCEQPSNTGWSCTNYAYGGVDANWCPGTSGQTPAPFTTPANGQFTDSWTLNSDLYLPVGCGYSITDPWSWLPQTTARHELATANGFLHTNAVQINGVTSTYGQAGMAPGTVMPK